MDRLSRLLAWSSALLFAAGLARAQTLELDHFNVYPASGATPPTGSVELSDQFGIGSTALGPPALFLVPALKNQEPGQDPFSHLTCYEIADPAPAGPPVTAINQFGEQALTLGQPRFLCAPTVKVMDPGPLGIDHFQCYAAVGERLDVGVAIRDQFQEQRVGLLDPFLFCNPADKNGEGIGNPNDHLACFNYDPPGAPVGSVPIANQFFPNTTELDVAEPNALCVPSEKRIDGGPVEHFAMYRATGPDGPVVDIVDQFGSQTTDLGEVNLFLVPANKNGEGLVDDISHLTCHEIFDGEPAPPQVIVENQFGSAVLDLGQPRELCLPTEKLLSPGLVSIDHFKCYEASGPSVDTDVDWSDQFQGVGIGVREPFLLCNPAEKNGEPISNPDDHLVCYRGDPPAPFELETDVVTQFNNGGPINLFGAIALCVPSSKTLPPKTPSVSAGGALALGVALALASMLSLGLWRLRRRG